MCNITTQNISHVKTGKFTEESPVTKHVLQQHPVKSKTGFTPMEMTDPHLRRNREILKKYPEIRDLQGPDIRLLPAVLAVCATQLCLAAYAATIESWWGFLFLAYSVGGVLTHSLSLANHELCHDLCFHSTLLNEILGVVANMPQAVPSFIAFKKYHHDHHYFLNEEDTDPDVPSPWEARTFNTPLLKALWMMLNPLMYGVRPLIMHPKPAGVKEVLNLTSVLLFDYAFAQCFGGKALLFNLLSTLLGMGIHPVAGHFITEHYDLYSEDIGQETHSYYGPLNYVTFNVGYHNEHHDFPKISGFRLPQVLNIAPEFYMNLKPHYSWTKVVIDYIMRPDAGPFAHLVRIPKNKKDTNNKMQ